MMMPYQNGLHDLSLSGQTLSRGKILLLRKPDPLTARFKRSQAPGKEVSRRADSDH
jgi:hypothetical protein